MRLLIILAFLAIVSFAQSQRYYITNLYVYDLFLMNPAAAGGDKRCTVFNGYYQSQWVEMDNAPSTQVFSFQHGLNSKLGMGSFIYNDRNGNVNQLGLQQSFSYEVKLMDKLKSQSQLAFGLSLNAEQAKISQGAFIGGVNPYDPAITGGTEMGWGLNANVGMMLNYNHHHVGMSFTNILPQNNPLYEGLEETNLPVDMHLHVGTSLKFPGRDIFLFPEIMYRRNNLADTRFDINMKLKIPTFNDQISFWGVIAYRRSTDQQLGRDLTLGTTAGINYGPVSMGLEYNQGLSGTQSFYGNAFQLVLGYRIQCRSSKKGAIPCKFMDVMYEGYAGQVKNGRRRR